MNPPEISNATAEDVSLSRIAITSPLLASSNPNAPTNIDGEYKSKENSAKFPPFVPPVTANASVEIMAGSGGASFRANNQAASRQAKLSRPTVTCATVKVAPNQRRIWPQTAIARGGYGRVKSRYGNSPMEA